jgi:hypothetical protein
MRLLHTREDRFEEFQISIFANRNPRYAILSHRWGGDEVSYQEFLWLISRNRYVGGKLMVLFTPILVDKKKKKGAGFAKIQNFRRLANLASYDWVWIDTCCIDKSSSAELSEAINSMFLWYEQSQVCWAYLDDVHPQRGKSGSGAISASGITKSKWFTRGWTLQELIAPKRLDFYDADWNNLGSKSRLADVISERITIDGMVLKEPETRYQFHVATRMQWAAGRETTRIEDRAYSLLGIFNVNLPLIYGEGDKAFLRLQEEIVRTSSDTSVFLHDSWRDIFAQGPDNFANTSPQSCIKVFQANFYRVSSVMEQISPRSFTKTNFGLHMNAMTVPVPLNAELYNIRLVLLETLHISPPRPHYLIVRHLHDQGVLRDPAINDKTWASLGNSIEGWTVMTVKQRKEAVEKVFERWDAWCRSVLAGGPKVEFDLDNWCERLNMTISVD